MLNKDLRKNYVIYTKKLIYLDLRQKIVEAVMDAFITVIGDFEVDLTNYCFFNFGQLFSSLQNKY
jgi:hypothetical protein